MSACTINGKQCTACCRAITLAYSRRRLLKMPYGGDAKFVLENWKPLSRRRAKKKNQYMIKSTTAKATKYWHCNKVTDTGCSVYDRRPRVCSDYPLYGKNRDELAMAYSEKNIPPEYHPDCTEWPRIQAVEVTD